MNCTVIHRRCMAVFSSCREILG